MGRLCGMIIREMNSLVVITWQEIIIKNIQKVAKDIHLLALQ